MQERDGCVTIWQASLLVYDWPRKRLGFAIYSTIITPAINSPMARKGANVGILPRLFWSSKL